MPNPMSHNEIAALLVKVRKELDFLSKRLDIAAQDVLHHADNSKSRKANKKKRKA